MWRYRKVYSVICMLVLLFSGVNYQLEMAEAAVPVAVGLYAAGTILVAMGLCFPDETSIYNGALWLQSELSTTYNDLQWLASQAQAAGQSSLEISDTIWNSVRTWAQSKFTVGEQSVVTAPIGNLTGQGFYGGVSGSGDIYLRYKLNTGAIHDWGMVYGADNIWRWYRSIDGGVFNLTYAFPIASSNKNWAVVFNTHSSWYGSMSINVSGGSTAFGGSNGLVYLDGYGNSASAAVASVAVTGATGVIDNPAHDLPRTSGAVRKVPLPLTPGGFDALVNKTVADVNVSDGANDPAADPPADPPADSPVVEGTLTEVVNALLGLPAALSGFFGSVVSAVQALPGTLEGFFTGIKDAVVVIPAVISTQLQVLFVPQANVEYRVEQLQWTFQSKQRMIGLPLPGDVPAGGGDVAPVWTMENPYTGGSMVLVDWSEYKSMVDRFKQILGGMMVVVTGIWAVRVWRPSPTID